ncbi:hypothetical protein C8R47DRAFT_1075289 [Mycena vitilis]|nr:hypothetical protein C8R47DRAFT_1075289 [Mycena vitilis]
MQKMGYNFWLPETVAQKFRHSTSNFCISVRLESVEKDSKARIFGWGKIGRGYGRRPVKELLVKIPPALLEEVFEITKKGAYQPAQSGVGVQPVRVMARQHVDSVAVGDGLSKGARAKKAMAGPVQCDRDTGDVVKKRRIVDKSGLAQPSSETLASASTLISSHALAVEDLGRGWRAGDTLELSLKLCSGDRGSVVVYSGFKISTSKTPPARIVNDWKRCQMGDALRPFLRENSLIRRKILQGGEGVNVGMVKKAWLRSGGVDNGTTIQRGRREVAWG